MNVTFAQESQEFLLSDLFGGLASALEKDPATWEKWWCAHLELQEDVPLQELSALCRSFQQFIHESLQSVDHRIYVVEPRALFVFCRRVQQEDLFVILHDSLMAMPTELSSALSRCDIHQGRQDSVALSRLCRIASAQLPHGYRAVDIQPNKEEISAEMQALGEVFACEAAMRGKRVPPRVLLVEDDPFSRRMVSNAIKEKVRLITAQTNEEAFSRYLMHAPDVVFLDINLPDGSGFDLLNRIRRLDPKAFVIMFSGNGYLENVVRAFDGGARGFIAKPFAREQLYHYLDHWRQGCVA